MNTHAKRTLLVVLLVVRCHDVCALPPKARRERSIPLPANPPASKSQESADDVSMELQSLSVSRPLPESQRLMHFGPNVAGGGTSLTFLLSSKSRHFIDFDAGSSEINSWRDDLGIEFLGSSPRHDAFAAMRDFSASVSDDGKLCLVTMTSRKLPRNGAKSIVIAGRLGIRCGNDQRTDRQEINFAQAARITVGPVAMTIEEESPDKEPGFEQAIVQSLGDVLSGALGEEANDAKYPFHVILTSEAHPRKVREISFTDLEGKEIPSQWLSKPSEYAADDQGPFEMIYGLLHKVDKAFIHVTYYADDTTITVPFESTVSIGLGGD